MERPRSVIVKTHWIMKVVSVFGTLFFAFATYMSAKTNSGTVVVLEFVGFTGLSVLCWFLADSFIEVSEESVLVSVIYGRYKILWSEITSVTTNGRMYSFEGNDKRVVISLSLAGGTTRQALQLVQEMCARRGVPILENISVPMTHRNSKVK
jgi:hypothetical protein